MKIVARKNDLEYNKDVKPLTIGKSSELKDYLMRKPNMTYYAILFCGDDQWHEEVEIETLGDDIYNFTKAEDDTGTGSIKFNFYMPCKFEKQKNKEMLFYSLLYNMSLQDNPYFSNLRTPLYKDNNLLSLKMSMDNAVLEYKSKERGLDIVPEIEISYQAYPYLQDRIFLGADAVAIYGAIYLVLIPLSAFMILYEEIIREKMLSLRFGLLVIGCSNAAFWSSWLITGVLFSAVMSTTMYISGCIFGFDFFVLTPFYVIFIFLFTVCMCFICYAAALCTVM